MMVITGDGPTRNGYPRFPGESESEARDRQNIASDKDADAVFKDMVAKLRYRGHVVAHAEFISGEAVEYHLL